MTTFIELTIGGEKTTFNTNSIQQIYNVEPSDRGKTAVWVLVNGKYTLYYADESYKDILIALGVGNVLDEQRRNQISNLLNSLVDWKDGQFDR